MSGDDINQLIQRVGIAIASNRHKRMVYLIPTPSGARRALEHDYPTFPLTPDDAITFADYLRDAAEFAMLGTETG
jgi:hypothetical protein